jgi:hypothetical protein
VRLEPSLSPIRKTPLDDAAENARKIYCLAKLYEAAQISKLLVPTYPITSPRMRLQVRPNYSTTSIPDPPNPWGKSLSLSKPSGMGNLVSL